MTPHIVDEFLSLVGSTAHQLEQLDPDRAKHKPAADRWSIQEVLGHLIDSAANNHQRFVRAQQLEELAFPAYEQEKWVATQCYNEASWPDLVDLWRCYNLHIAHVIRHVSPDALSVVCRIGANEPVTLLFLIEDYVVHLQHHLQQIAQRLADQPPDSVQ